MGFELPISRQVEEAMDDRTSAAWAFGFAFPYNATMRVDDVIGSDPSHDLIGLLAMTCRSPRMVFSHAFGSQLELL